MFKIYHLILFALFLVPQNSFAGKDDPNYKPFRSLPTNSLIVGCNGHGCKLHAGECRLLQGFSREAAHFFQNMTDKGLREKGKSSLVPDYCKTILDFFTQEVESLYQHKHEGTTLDLCQRAPGVTHPHLQGNILTFDFKDRVYDAIFFELFPPDGANFNEQNQLISEPNPDVMSQALAVARKILSDQGKLAMQLAIDIEIRHDHTKEKLELLRARNPFMGYFNNCLSKVYEGLQSQGEKSTDLINQAIKFYLTKTRQRIDEIIKKVRQVEPTKKILHEQLESYLQRFVKLDAVTYEDMLLKPESDQLDIVRSIFRLMVVFKQRDMMIEYVNTHGFKNAQLEWLEADEHKFNKSAGWFLTAEKDPSFR